MLRAHFNSVGGSFKGGRWGPIDLAQCRQSEKSLVLLQLAIFLTSGGPSHLHLLYHPHPNAQPTHLQPEEQGGSGLCLPLG